MTELVKVSNGERKRKSVNRGGRPRLPAGYRKDVTLSGVRLSPLQLAIVQRSASDAGCSLAYYVRDKLGLEGQ